MKRVASAMAGFLVFAMAVRADEAHDLLRAVSTKYESISTYEFQGTEVISLPGTQCTFELAIDVAGAPPAFPGGISFHSSKSKISTECLDAVTKLGAIASPDAWSHFGSIDVGVESVRELPPAVLKLPGQEIRCTILEVLYDAYYRKIKGFVGPVRYWVDPETQLIRRAEFDDNSLKNLLSCKVTIEKIRIGGPAASWLGPSDAPFGTASVDRQGRTRL